jgi:hypothetical protein
MLTEIDETMTTMDGFDDCVEGIVERFNQQPIVCYNKQKLLVKLTSEGMTPEQALEYYEFNQLGAWVGEATPCFIITTNTNE